ncbi:hypothetical protein [Chryseosolibacter indicus]|uniref:Uncharacterized protein n=1 Tax=Chryseosolibacter indicus TaxID=2782351 RepID=A0ABS5VT78_9BACT|nr:hypothetical protein [Chryseosolibacter indicus]MBT1704084.1 hypothetical protein [Chryseosolibacter indicus]
MARRNMPIDIVITKKIFKGPIHDTFKVLGGDYNKVSKKLQSNGISIGDANTMEEIWIKNNTTADELINLITE